MNNLFPIFIKLSEVRILLVGAGYVGHEKLSALLRQDSGARIHIVGLWVSSGVRELASRHSNVTWRVKRFDPSDLEGARLALAATDDQKVNERVRNEARKRGILANVADTPDVCDFYLGSIVRKGNLKVGISTNGQSPTFAKRFREYLEATLPAETDELLCHLNNIRDQMDVEFAEKVRVLNEVTRGLQAGGLSSPGR